MYRHDVCLRYKQNVCLLYAKNINRMFVSYIPQIEIDIDIDMMFVSYHKVLCDTIQQVIYNKSYTTSNIPFLQILLYNHSETLLNTYYN